MALNKDTSDVIVQGDNLKPSFEIINVLGAVDLSRLLLQQLVWYLDKAEYVTCSWLLAHTKRSINFK